jgi:hypothetical protein
LHVVDVADAARPTRLRTVDLPAGASRVEVLDGIAYVASGSALAAVELVTGDVLETLGLGGADLTGLAREGRLLYTMDGAGVLRVIDASGPGMIARGNLAVPSAAGELFVGDGIAYLTARQSLDGGFATVDVSDPDAPTLISGPDVTGEAPDRAIGVNAGRIGLLVGPSGGFDAVDVMDVRNPAATDVFRTRVLLPQAPQGVALASGVGLVADGDAGLRVVGYQATDVAGQPPVLTIDVVVEDADPGTAGIQVIEGQTILVLADTRDDVDLRQMELLVDGVAAARDTTFPHEALIPAGRAGAVLTLQARGTDPGGNLGLSNTVSIQVVADTVAPAVVAFDPAGGASEPEGLQQVRVRFSEGLDPATVTTDTFRVIDGAGLTVAPLAIALLGGDRVVELRYAGLAAGDYQIAIDGPSVTDRAGNALAAGDVTSEFTLTGDAIEWINPAGGFWDVAANWEGGVLPGPDDNVVIDVPGDILIVHRTGTSAINRLISRESIDLTGGTLDVATTVLVDGTFNLGNGGTLAHATVLRGAGFTPAVGGFAEFDGVTLATDLRIENQGDLFVRNGLTLMDRARIVLNGAAAGASIHFTETQTLSGSGEIFFAGANDQNFIRMETLTIGPDILIHGDQGGRVGDAFSNDALVLEGTILAGANGETLEIDVATWTNEGLLRAENGGILELGGAFTQAGAGTFQAAGGDVVLVGTLDLESGALALTSETGNLTVSHEFARIRNGRITTSDSVKLDVVQGTFDAIVLATDLTMPGLRSLTVLNGLTLEDAVITLEDDAGFSGPQLIFSGTQTLGGTGEVVFGGTGDAGAISVRTGATLTIGPDITIHGTRGGSVGILGSVINQGTISAETNGRSIDVFGPAIANQGTMRAVNGGDLFVQAFTNTGTVEIGATGSLFRVLNGNFVQTQGSVSLAGGTLTANTVDIQGGLLSGFGTVSGALRNAGTMTLGNAADATGTLTVQGPFQQTSTGVLNLDIGGTATTAFDRLVLTGATGVATLAGTLNVSIIDGFTPVPGQIFDVLTFASRQGTFEAINGLDVGGGLALQAVFDPAAAPTRLRLTAVPA